MAAATPVEGRGDVWLLWQFFSVYDAACRDAILGFQVLRTISVSKEGQVLFYRDVEPAPLYLYPDT